MIRQAAYERLRKLRGSDAGAKRRSGAPGGDSQTKNGGLMVLVDTPVWIRFLANQMPWAAELDRLLERDEAAGHELVYGELLMGDSGGRT